MRFPLTCLSLGAALTACGGNVGAPNDGAASGGRAMQVATAGASADRGRSVTVAGGAVVGGVTVIACGQIPRAIAVDATDVYWLNESQVAKAPKGGGPVTVLIDEKFPTPAGWGIALDSTSVYWPGNHGLQSMRKDGSSHTVLSTRTDTYDLAVNDTFVFLTRPGIYTLPKAGGKLAPVGSDPEIDSVSSVIHVTLDGGYVYYTDWGGGHVLRAPVNGGPAEIIVSGVPYTNDVAVHGGVVHFSDANGGLWSAPAKPGSRATRAKDAYAYGVAADSSGVYAAGFSVGKIFRYSPATGAVTILATGQFFPRGIAVDETAIYWTNDSGIGELQGCIMKIGKPMGR